MEEKSVKQGRPFTFSQQAMIVLFTILQFRKIYRFKRQHEWLEAHPELLPLLKLKGVPHHTTFSRRYKQLYDPCLTNAWGEATTRVN